MLQFKHKICSERLDDKNRKVTIETLKDIEKAKRRIAVEMTRHKMDY